MPARSTTRTRRATAATPDAGDLQGGCGCVLPPVAHATRGTTRKAVAVDPDAKARNLRRLRRIEGQVRGLQNMVEDERYCADILTQMASVHEALRAVQQELLRNHLRHCTRAALAQGPAQSEAILDELFAVLKRYA